MKLTMLGTGNALVAKCYNTCFVIEGREGLFMTDGGGGNAVLAQLARAEYSWKDVRHIFVTHKHIDHLLGVVWMVRMICQFMAHGDYSGEAYLYSHAEVLALLRDMAARLLPGKEAAFIDRRLHLVEVNDGQTLPIAGHAVTFFDILSTKARQYGYRMELDGGKKLVCCGDEPLKPGVEHWARGCDWLLHEAFCLHAQADIFDPYEKHHSTVKDACELAERLGVKNLLLYHTEDRTLPRRAELYREEGSRFYRGNLWIPDDLGSVEL